MGSGGNKKARGAVKRETLLLCSKHEKGRSGQKGRAKGEGDVVVLDEPINWVEGKSTRGKTFTEHSFHNIR